MEIKSFYKVRVTYYAASSLLNLLKEKEIKVYDFKIISTYEYSFKLTIKDYKKIKKQLKSIKINNEYGLYLFFKRQMKKVTLYALIFSFILFMFCSSLLLKIQINGTSSSLNENIASYLKSKSISIYKIKPTLTELKKIKDEYYLANIDKYETIDFILTGNVLKISYTLKKNEIEIEEKHPKMYAKKDGIIDKIEISSGNVLVKEYDYVTKGQLLVDDYFYYKDNPIYIGTRGKIYAYTYEKVLLTYNYELEKEDIYIYLLDEARRKVSLDFEEDEYIKEEIIKDFYQLDGIVYLYVFYSLYENIIFY